MITTHTLHGIGTRKVTIERVARKAQLVVGVSDTADREITVRVRAALATVGVSDVPFSFLVHGAHMPGTAPSLDLRIAIAVLQELGQAPTDETPAFGELGFDGSIRPVRGLYVLTRAVDVPAIISSAQAAEGKKGDFPLSSFGQLYGRTTREFRLAEWPHKAVRATDPFPERLPSPNIGAARSILIRGAPGSGKTLLARALRTKLPALDAETLQAVLRIYSAAGIFPPEPEIPPPFRAPHHSVSEAGLLGGGTAARPGEVTLAHGGVLFLDEVHEFRSRCLEGLRGALRSGDVLVSRSTTLLPAAPALVIGTTNPCPCGYFGRGRVRSCICSPSAIKRHEQRVAAALPWDLTLDMEELVG